MSIWLPKKPSKGRIRDAENARRNRHEIIKARSQGQITRRDLLKWGLFTAAGGLAWKQGLNPLVSSAYAAIPTGLPSSPLFGVLPFTQPMPRFDVLPRIPVAALTDRAGRPLAPTKEANTTQQPLDPALPGVAPVVILPKSRMRRDLPTRAQYCPPIRPCGESAVQRRQYEARWMNSARGR